MPVRASGSPNTPDVKAFSMTFADLGLSEPILRAVAADGYSSPTPIQAQAIPLVLAGRDLFGCAQTGTGKTAAFALPILHRLTAAPRRSGAGASPGAPRVLVLAPTRELASQIAESFRAYGRHLRHRVAVLFGGVNQHHQVKALQRGVEILVATPGRLLDLMGQGHVDLRTVEALVLDEADRMFDMGFIHDIRKVVGRLPRQRQTLLFSATMPREIRALAEAILRDPASVQVTPVATPVETIEQSVYHVPHKRKPALLKHLLQRGDAGRTIVFTRTKHGADKVVRELVRCGIPAEAIHGNKSQNARTRALERFKSQSPPVLVATDIASRGIDVDGVTHVINFDVPHEPETYVHRIGRTARAGASGVAVSFCDHAERLDLVSIERLIRRTIVVRNDHPVYDEAEMTFHAGERRAPSERPRHDHRGGGRRSGPPHRGGNRPEGSGRAGHRAAPRSSSANGGAARSHDAARSEAPASGPGRSLHRNGRGGPRRGWR